MTGHDISRSSQFPQAELYAFSVRNPIPDLRVPLQPPEPEPLLDLQTLLIAVYNQARFNLAIDYRIPPRPPIKTADREWLDTLLKEQNCVNGDVLYPAAKAQQLYQ